MTLTCCKLLSMAADITWWMLCVEYWLYSHFSHKWPGCGTKYWPCVVVPIGWYNLYCTVFCSILGAFSIIVSAIAKKQVLSHKVRNCWLTVTNLWLWVVDPFSKHQSGVLGVWSYWRSSVECGGRNWSVSMLTWTLFTVIFIFWGEGQQQTMESEIWTSHWFSLQSHDAAGSQRILHNITVIIWTLAKGEQEMPLT